MIWVSVQTLLSTTALPREWVFGAYLERRQVALLVGPAGASKSTAALAVAVAVATGGSFAGETAPQPATVLVVSGEEDHSELQRKLTGIIAQAGIGIEDIGDRLQFSSGGPIKLMEKESTNRLSETSFVNDLTRYAIEVGAALLILDPLIEFHPANENLNEEMGAVLTVIRRIARDANCAVLVVHHTGKGAKPGDLDAARGASSIAGVVRSYRTLTPLDDKERERMKLPVSQAGGYAVLHDAKTSHTALRTRGIVLERQSIVLTCGESVGVLVTVGEGADAAIAYDDSRLKRIAAAMGAVIEDELSVSQCCEKLLQQHPKLFPGYKAVDEYKGKLPGRLRDLVKAVVLRGQEAPAQFELVEVDGQGGGGKKVMIRRRPA
ncbi:MAG TPA: AAA family ATPase, partial [Magnetospirillum sp.]|nr:AAA family ATPase [Magnetospirillum sp.]